MKPLLFSALLLLASACKSSNPEVPHRASVEMVQSDPGPLNPEPTPADVDTVAPSAVEAVVSVEPVVARVAGEDVFVSELLATWMRVDSVGLRDLLENIVVERIIMQEARRIDLTIDELRVGEAYVRALTELENDLKENQPGVSLDDWIVSTLGLEPERYREGLELDVRRRLHAERIVRQFILGQEWADVRVLVLEKRNEAEAALARLEAGEPFARIAGEVSVDPSGRRGGQIPPVVRNDSALARLAFATPVGGFGGPILEGQRWLVIETRALHEPLAGKWHEVAPQVEASLAERPVEELEFMLWKAEMSRRTPADFEPLFELIRTTPR
jgi:hypothetical protein